MERADLVSCRFAVPGGASDCAQLLSYLRLVFDGGREQRDGVLLGDAPLDGLLAQPLQPRLSVEGGQVQQTCGSEPEDEAFESGRSGCRARCRARGHMRLPMASSGGRLIVSV